jgi:hypothetical protein
VEAARPRHCIGQHSCQRNCTERQAWLRSQSMMEWEWSTTQRARQIKRGELRRPSTSSVYPLVPGSPVQCGLRPSTVGLRPFALVASAFLISFSPWIAGKAATVLFLTDTAAH